MRKAPVEARERLERQLRDGLGLREVAIEPDPYSAAVLALVKKPDDDGVGQYRRVTIAYETLEHEFREPISERALLAFGAALEGAPLRAEEHFFRVAGAWRGLQDVIAECGKDFRDAFQETFRILRDHEPDLPRDEGAFAVDTFARVRALSRIYTQSFLGAVQDLRHKAEHWRREAEAARRTSIGFDPHIAERIVSQAAYELRKKLAPELAHEIALATAELRRRQLQEGVALAARLRGDFGPIVVSNPSGSALDLGMGIASIDGEPVGPRRIPVLGKKNPPTSLIPCTGGLYVSIQRMEGTEPLTLEEERRAIREAYELKFPPPAPPAKPEPYPQPSQPLRVEWDPSRAGDEIDRDEFWRRAGFGGSPPPRVR